MKNITKLFRKALIITGLVLACNVSDAQLVGEFLMSNDGHYYFSAVNTYNTSGVITVTAISYYNDVANEESIIIRGYGDGFVLGPSTPWRWYWHYGDRIYITYPDGSSTYWDCPYTDFIYGYSINYQGGENMQEINYEYVMTNGANTATYGIKKEDESIG